MLFKIYKDGIKIFPLKFGIKFTYIKSIKGFGIWKSHCDLYISFYFTFSIYKLYMGE